MKHHRLVHRYQHYHVFLHFEVALKWDARIHVIQTYCKPSALLVEYPALPINDGQILSFKPGYIGFQMCVASLISFLACYLSL